MEEREVVYAEHFLKVSIVSVNSFLVGLFFCRLLHIWGK